MIIASSRRAGQNLIPPSRFPLSVAYIDPNNLPILRDQLLAEIGKGTPIRDAYIALGSGFGMSTIDLNVWSTL